MSFRISLSTLKLFWCVIYLASEKYTVFMLISRDEKINASAVLGPLRLGAPGPGPPGPLDKTALLTTTKTNVTHSWAPRVSPRRWHKFQRGTFLQGGNM